MHDLFDSLPEVAAIQAQLQAETAAKAVHTAQSAVLKARRRREMRRAKSEAQLAELLPAELEADCSYHVISRGDIDSRSFIEHVLRHQPLDELLVSTWCMAMQDLDFFQANLESGRIGALRFYVGEIFPSQYPDEFTRLERLVARESSRCAFAVARNHSKVMAGAHHASGYYVVTESSANVNTNPRIEQTCLTRSEDLYWFYREFFDGIRSIHRAVTV